MIARGSSASAGRPYACVMCRALVFYAKAWRSPSWSRHVSLACVETLLVRHVSLHSSPGVVPATL